jgi:hypothetical protein
LEAFLSALTIGKDAVYRLLNSTTANWRRFLLLLGKRIAQQILPLTAEETRKVLIADDTFYDRNRSKKVELLARVHDHSTKRYLRGFRMLTLGWSDGNSFIPLALSMLSSANEKNRLVPMRDGIDKRSNGYKRRLESLSKAPDMLLEMVTQAIDAGIEARHLLVDSWFAFPATIRRIKALKMDTICMLKDTSTITYDWNGWPLTLKKLYKSVRKHCGRAKVLADTLISIGNDDQGKPIMAKIVFIRDRNSKQWLALLSTDTGLTADEIVKLYNRRWDIEVFFKISKSFLGLAKEFQSRSFDALVAQATLVCCRYMLLELSKREKADPRTMGRLFHSACDEMRQIGLQEALCLLLELLHETLDSVVGLCKEQVQTLIERFIQAVPRVFRSQLLFLTANH